MENRTDQQVNTKEILDAFYRDALELRSKVLRDNTGLDQQTYTEEIWKLLVPYFNKMTNYLSSQIPESTYKDIHARMLEIVYSVSSMLVQKK